MIRRLLAAMVLVLLVTASCDRPPRIHKETLYVFGTLVEIILFDVDAETANRAAADLSSAFRAMHDAWHAWRPGQLDTLNRGFAEGRTVEVSPDLAAMVGLSKRYFAASDGLFNPAIGRLIGLWGFHADDLPQGAAPDPEDVRRLVAADPGMDDVTLDGTRISSRNPAVQLDFGGFAKGVAMDRGIALLRARGIANAVLNAGGGLDVIGRPGDRAWRIGIRHPVGWGVIASVDLGDGETLYTSGNYERFREHEGVRYGHILDPRTGMPVRDIVSASVIHANGGLADAAATALAVAGPADWARIARRMGIDQALVVDVEGTVHATPTMAARIDLLGDPPPRLVVAGGTPVAANP